MGSTLSPIVANLIMEAFEHKALDQLSLKPFLFLRYTEDTFVICSHGWDNLNEFLVFLNGVHPYIHFTMEVARLGQLPFLVVLVYRKVDGAMSKGTPLTPIYN